MELLASVIKKIEMFNRIIFLAVGGGQSKKSWNGCGQATPVSGHPSWLQMRALALLEERIAKGDVRKVWRAIILNSTFSHDVIAAEK